MAYPFIEDKQLRSLGTSRPLFVGREVLCRRTHTQMYLLVRGCQVQIGIEVRRGDIKWISDLCGDCNRARHVPLSGSMKYFRSLADNH